MRYLILYLSFASMCVSLVSCTQDIPNTRRKFVEDCIANYNAAASPESCTESAFRLYPKGKDEITDTTDMNTTIETYVGNYIQQ